MKEKKMQNIPVMLYVRDVVELKIILPVSRQSP